jgi:uncharacterized membrane protein YcaP (DUF421 family)
MPLLTTEEGTAVWGEMGATWDDLARAVISTVGIYLALVVLVRVIGQRSLSSMSSFDFGCVVALGAVLGRTVLLRDPTLLIGVVALTTFFVIQGVLGLLRRYRGFDRLINRSPVLLMSGDELQWDAMRRSHVSEDEMRQRLRLAGIRHRQEVQCVVLERNGNVSVIRRGEDVDPWLLSDVTDGAVAADRS